MSDSFDRLADLMDEAAAAIAAGEVLDPAALAARFELDGEDVTKCLRALEALDESLDEDTDAEHALRPPALPGDYEVRGELGRGGMGIVYRVHQKSLDREVALKVLRPGDLALGGAIRRFEREARSLARLRHRHIVSVHEVGHADGFVYFTMDLVEGQTLEDLIKAGKVTATQTVKLLRQVASAIGYAHSQGIVHRDLKPANILVDGNGDAFVVDFGLASDADSDGAGATLSGQLIGTPAYMSPEQVRGDREQIGEATDIYALGAVLYQCLAGKPPFHKMGLAHLMRAVLEEAPQSPRKINPRTPKPLEIICNKAMAKRPEDRYPTAQALIDDLERFAAGEVILAKPAPRFLRTIHWAWARKSQFVGFAAASILSAVLAWFWLTPEADRSDILAVADSLIVKRNYAGAIATYRKALDGLSPERVPIGSLYRFVASLTKEAARIRWKQGNNREVQELLEEAASWLPPTQHNAMPFELESWGTLTRSTDGIKNFNDWDETQRTKNALNMEFAFLRAIAGDRLPRLNFSHAPQAAIIWGIPVTEKRLFLLAALLADRNNSWLVRDRWQRHLGKLLRKWSTLPEPTRERLEEIIRDDPIRHWPHLLKNAQPGFHAMLVSVIGDANVPLPIRRLAFDLLSGITDHYCGRIRYVDGEFTTHMRPSDLRHVVELHAATKGLEKVDAYKKRLESYAAFLPGAAMTREEERRSEGYYPVATYLEKHTGREFRTRAEWNAWWAKHHTEDPVDWLLEALAWGPDPLAVTPDRILERYRELVEKRKSSLAIDHLNHLLELCQTEGEPPIRSGRRGSRDEFLRWVDKVGFKGGGTRNIRLAVFGFLDGDPRPKLLWRIVQDVRANKTVELSHKEPSPARFPQYRVALRGQRAHREAWDGKQRDATPQTRILGRVSLRWDGKYFRGEVDLDDRIDQLGNSSSTEGAGPVLLPGCVQFLQRGTFQGHESGHVYRTIQLGMLTDATDTEEWSLADWQRAIRRTMTTDVQVAHEHDTTPSNIAENIAWGLQFFPVPQATDADIATLLAKRHEDTEHPTTLMKLMTGDDSGTREKFGDLAAADTAVRIALHTKSDRIRAFALEQFRDAPLPKALATTLRSADIRDEIELPPWLAAKVADAGRPSTWDAVSNGVVAGLWILGAGIVLGLVGVLALFRMSTARRVPAFVLALSAAILAHTQIEFDGYQLVPAWTCFVAIGLASWFLFWKQRKTAWISCPIWWIGFAAFDLIMRLTVETTASPIGFWIGAILFFGCLTQLVADALHPDAA